MTTAISPISRQVSKPYLSLAEFKNAPTALDYGNLVVGGNQAAQDAELTNAITRASSWIDQYCNQVLSATVDTEQQRVRFRPDGTVAIHPKYWPVVSVSNISLGATPNEMWTAPDPSICWLEEQSIIYPYAQMPQTMSSQGPLSFGFPYTSGHYAYANYTYINGYANTSLDVQSAVGATSLTVDDATGIVPGEWLTIFDGANTERIQVATTYSYGASVVTLAAPTLYAHAVGVTVSALPAAIKQAAIVMTSAFLKIRGDASLTMAVTARPTNQISGNDAMGGEQRIAEEILKPFRRIR
jgi:hypothetical protein